MEPRLDTIRPGGAILTSKMTPGPLRTTESTLESSQAY